MIYANEASLFHSFFLIHDFKKMLFFLEDKKRIRIEKNIVKIELCDHLFSKDHMRRNRSGGYESK